MRNATNYKEKYYSYAIVYYILQEIMDIEANDVLSWLKFYAMADLLKIHYRKKQII